MVVSDPNRDKMKIEHRENLLGNDPEEDQGIDVVVANVIKSREILVHP